MRIAIGSLSQFTYVAEFIDAVQGLNERHEICYFLGFYCQNSIKLLQQKHISYQVLLDERIDIKSALIDPATAKSPYEIFQGCFFKYAELLLPDLLKTIKAWKPNLIGSHYRDYASMTVAEILDIPMVSFGSAGSPFRVKGIDPPYGVGVSRDSPDRVMHIFWEVNQKFNNKIDQLYNEQIRRPYGLNDISGVSTLHSNQLVLLSSISSLSNKYSPDPPYLKFVGPLFSSRLEAEEVEETDTIACIASSPKPRIFISLGTIYLEPTEKCLEALKNFPGTVIVSLGGKNGIEIASLSPRKNVIGRPFFNDFYKVLKLVDAVVTIASGKTVLESLSVGKPLICLPQQGEQYENALRLQSLGAGEIPCPKCWDAKKFARVTEQVATEERYKQAAAILQIEIEKSGGVNKVIKEIETLDLSGSLSDCI
jgi:UDP:flavonoid glycosyltransferase YjiC (YdhE family)